MDKIRLATPEEVVELAKQYTARSPAEAWAFEREGNQTPDFGIIKSTTEIDFSFCTHENLRRRFLFLWHLETLMRKLGIQEYFFNVDAKDEQYQKNIEKFGAVKDPDPPEIRYKKVL